MHYRSSAPLAAVVALGTVLFAPSAACAENTGVQALYADVIDLRGKPHSARDHTINVFFDQGAWHGYSLQAVAEGLGFVGPMLLAQDGGSWAAARFAQLEIVDQETGRALELSRASVRSHALPGRLTADATVEGLAVRETLIFSGARTALVRIDLRATRARRISLVVHGGPSLAGGRYSAKDAEIVETFPSSRLVVRTTLLEASVAQVNTEGTGYRLGLTRDIELAAGQTHSVFLAQSCLLDPTETASVPSRPGLEFAANAARWQGYMESVFRSSSPLMRTARYRRVAVKAIETLISNWRGPSGDLRHDGLFPSYSNPDFHGFWAWDSWKHAAALASFAPALARNQIRAMFDYQNDAGMIADVVYRDRKENNWRNTKPPLAAWAVWEIHAATKDRDFLAEMFPRLVRYHRWWYAERDHDQDGLAEYGSTDGTRIAAAWESGMDNAVRFDSAQVLRSGERAWSLDRESVDLNSFLYLEKRRLADIARALGEPGAAADFEAQARSVAEMIRERMFDPATGYFYDVSITQGTPVRVMGPEGWIPLWAGVATDAQARAVARVMIDPRKFATWMPFPTLAADHPEFSPVEGYWRGPVWIDQAYFAVEGLRSYGLRRDSEAMRRRLLDRAAGLLGSAPIFENYDPLTGAGVQAPNFSWSAAHYLLLVTR